MVGDGSQIYSALESEGIQDLGREGGGGAEGAVNLKLCIRPTIFPLYEVLGSLHPPPSGSAWGHQRQED